MVPAGWSRKPVAAITHLAVSGDGGWVAAARGMALLDTASTAGHGGASNSLD